MSYCPQSCRRFVAYVILQILGELRRPAITSVQKRQLREWAELLPQLIESWGLAVDVEKVRLWLEDRRKTAVVEPSSSFRHVHTRREAARRAAEMRRLYLSGKTCSEVGRAFGLTRQSAYGTLKSHGCALRPKKRLRGRVVDGVKYTKIGGVWRSTVGKRFLHVQRWEAFHDRRVPKGFQVSFVDGNPDNYSASNLKLTRKGFNLKPWRFPKGSNGTRWKNKR